MVGGPAFILFPQPLRDRLLPLAVLFQDPRARITFRIAPITIENIAYFGLPSARIIARASATMVTGKTTLVAPLPRYPTPSR